MFVSFLNERIKFKITMMVNRVLHYGVHQY